MSQHDGRLYNYLEQIVSLLKSRRLQRVDEKPTSPGQFEVRREGREKTTLWISVAAVIIALFAAGFTGWQAWEAHKARIEGGQQAADALSTSERAYLAVGTISIYCPPCEHPAAIRPNDKGVITINVTNFGKTPASDVEINVTRHSEIGHKLPAGFDFAEDLRANTPPTYIAPDPTNPLPIHLAAAADEIASARNQVPVHHEGEGSEAEYLYIYGHISYSDVFQKRHIVLFCRGYTGPAASMPEFWSRCPEHEGENDSFVPKKLAVTPGFNLPDFDVPEPPDNVPRELREQRRKLQSSPR